MKHSFLSIGLLSLATFSAVVSLSHRPASAQCVMNDINFQSSMNGSGRPTERTNNVNQTSQGGCVGNSVTTTNVQTQVGGTDRAVQNRTSNQRINGSNNSPTGINMEPVKIQTNVQIDVYNAADKLPKKTR